jgi:hypothetical protein
MKIYGKSFKDHFDHVAANGVFLYKSSSNFNILLFENNCYAIAINKSCKSSFFGDLEHVYKLIYNDIKRSFSFKSVFVALKRFIKLQKYFDSFDFKKSQIKIY